MDSHLAVLVDQVAAWRRVEHLVDAELWRTDKRARWLAMLRRLVCSMSWSTGVVSGVTLAQLAEAGGCATRTVSRLLAWAQDADLLVMVEAGAAAEFLGTDHNRAPSYVFVVPSTLVEEQTVNRDAASGDQAGDCAGDRAVTAGSAQLRATVDKNGDLPPVSVGKEPLTKLERLKKSASPPSQWPLWRIPSNSAERNAAVSLFLSRISLGRSRAPAWRARALLARWWAEGVCVAGLLWMIDHHPDQPDRLRGDALRGAVDPLRVIGHRLHPWIGQLHRLPPELAGRHGDYQREQADRLTARIAAATEHGHRATAATPAADPDHRLSTAAARQAARAALEMLLADRARRRTQNRH